MRVRVDVKPGSRTEGVTPLPDGSLAVKVRAPAREGKANRAVIELVAAHFNVPRTAVRLVSGGRGRRKLLELPDR